MGNDLITKIEQEAIAFIDEKRKEARPKMTIDALASAVFPGIPISNARMVLQRMRKPQANGKTRSVSLGEFVEMTRALKLSPLDALGVILNRIDETKV